MSAEWNLIIDQGASWGRTFYWKLEDGTPIPLSAFTAKMQIRPSVDSDRVIVELNTTPSDGKGLITLGSDDGSICTTLTAEQTAALDFSGCARGSVKEGDNLATGLIAAYDLDLTSSDGTVTMLVGGKVCFVREVTR